MWSFASYITYATWSVNFSPEESASNGYLGETVSTLEWSVKGVTSLLAICLYIYAGKRATQGDYTGAFLSFLGSSLIAIAPFLYLGV